MAQAQRDFVSDVDEVTLEVLGVVDFFAPSVIEAKWK